MELPRPSGAVLPMKRVRIIMCTCPLSTCVGAGAHNLVTRALGGTAFDRCVIDRLQCAAALIGVVIDELRAQQRHIRAPKDEQCATGLCLTVFDDAIVHSEACSICTYRPALVAAQQHASHCDDPSHNCERSSTIRSSSFGLLEAAV
jgi:hypothetical protein|eukprot:3634979-Prymnesium_polylepis.2